jgi:hypothetical protein
MRGKPFFSLTPHPPFLFLSSIFLDLCFQFDDEFADGWLIHGLDPAERFVEHAPLVLRPIGSACDAPELASIISCAGRPDAFDDPFIDRDHHRRDSRHLNGARRQSD